jgi:uncharacterized membrane protein (TIGR02234 family)
VDVAGTPTSAHSTAWWYVALFAAVLALAGAALAVRYAGTWPEMGSKYDAPTAHTVTPDPSQMEELDLWRAIDQGRDPTDPDAG